MLSKRDDLRPESLEDYIGQEEIKDLLTTSILSAKSRNQPLDHVLLNGPPGLGKTTLALIIARMMNRELKIILGPSLGGPGNVVTLIYNLGKNTDLFIDEVHRVRKATQEILYPLLEDGVLQSSLNSSVRMEIPPMTIIAATTNIGRLERPFIDRFGLQFQLQYYNVDELSEILQTSAEKLKIAVDFDVLDIIASRSRGTPRIANNILKRMRDYLLVMKVDDPTIEFTNKIILTKLRTDELGLKPLDYRYMRALLNTDRGLGVAAIASMVNEEVETIEDFVEPFLLTLGFIQRERTGRCLTEAGTQFILSKAKVWK